MADRNARTWKDEDRYWRENYASRPYTDESQGYERYQGGYRYGTEMGTRHQGRKWDEAEPEPGLSGGPPRPAARG